jgi:exopolysaccharide production protein ExoQ
MKNHFGSNDRFGPNNRPGAANRFGARARPGASPGAPLYPSAAAAAKPAARRQRRPIAITLAIVFLLAFTIAPENFDYSTFAPDSGVTDATRLAMPTEGSAFSRTMWLALLALGVGVPLARWGRARKLLSKVNPFLLLFFALAAVSTVWSIEPGVTFRRFVRAFTIAADFFAFVLIAGQAVTFQSVLRTVYTVVVVGSIVFVLAEPTWAIEQSNQLELVGAWRGLTTQKNGLGSIAAVCMILWLHAALSKQRHWFPALLGAALAAVCLVKSRSSTSIMAGAFATLLLFFLLKSPLTLRRYMPYLIGLFVAALLTYSLAVLNLIPGSGMLLGPIASLTGKDLTFSGRTAIWNIINENIARSPLVGSGYGAYWTQQPESPSMAMLQRLYFYPTEGHNGYLDVINDLGVLGALCLLAFLLMYLRQGLSLYKTHRVQGALFLTLLFEQLVANLSESRWFNTLSPEFVMFTFATIALGRMLLDRDAPAQPRGIRIPARGY